MLTTQGDSFGFVCCVSAKVQIDKRGGVLKGRSSVVDTREIYKSNMKEG